MIDYLKFNSYFSRRQCRQVSRGAKEIRVQGKEFNKCNLGIGDTDPSSILDVSGGNLTMTNETAVPSYIKFSAWGYIQKFLIFGYTKKPCFSKYMYDNGTTLILGYD